MKGAEDVFKKSNKLRTSPEIKKKEKKGKKEEEEGLAEILREIKDEIVNMREEMKESNEKMDMMEEGWRRREKGLEGRLNKIGRESEKNRTNEKGQRGGNKKKIR